MDILTTTSLLGAAVGLIMGLTGAGGGILSVPLLVFFLHFSVAQASPIALSAIAMASTIATLIGLRNGLLRYKAAALMAVTGLLSAPLGLYLSQVVPNAPLLALFGAVLLWVSFRSVSLTSAPLQNQSPPCQLDDSIGKLIWTLPCARALFLSGAWAGFLSGLLGVGGGFVLVPALQKYTNLPQRSVVATSLGVLAIVSTGALVMAGLAGHLPGATAVPFTGGAVAGLMAGKWLEPKIPVRRMQLLFGLVAACVGTALIIKSLV
jgi:uncharacterized membrane protein YfcA